MKFKGIFVAVTCVLAVLLAMSKSARADEVIYQGVGFMTGTQSLQDTFSVAGPGTLTVSLKDFGWPVAFYNLDMVVTTPQGLLGPEFGAGTTSFDIAAATTINAQWFGTAVGPLGAGLYGLTINFAPSATTVPLPSTLVLLLSGLAFLIWQRRNRPVAATVRAV